MRLEMLKQFGTTVAAAAATTIATTKKVPEMWTCTRDIIHKQSECKRILHCHSFVSFRLVQWVLCYFVCLFLLFIFLILLWCCWSVGPFWIVFTSHFIPSHFYWYCLCSRAAFIQLAWRSAYMSFDKKRVLFYCVRVWV